MGSDAEQKVAEDLYGRYSSAWSNHDMDALLACWNEGGTHEDVVVDEVHTGLADLRVFYEESFEALPDLRLEGGACFLAGENFCGEWVLSGTRTAATSKLPATELPYRVRGLSIGRVVDGRFAALRDYWNMVELAMQLGLMPNPAG